MIKILPHWFRQEIISETAFSRLKEIKVNTVCQSAHCPNFSACLDKNRLTVIILGDICTRSCAFCAVKKSASGLLPLDIEEPFKVAQEIKNLGLKYVVITSVTRDDLADGGAEIFSRTVESVKELCAGIIVEVLIPDFKGSIPALEKVVSSRPAVIGHNIETIRRLYPAVRPQANYDISLKLLASVKKIHSCVLTKSSIMLGMGEAQDEVFAAMEDLRAVDCDILTLGQYLAPSENHYQAKDYITPQAFDFLREKAVSFGFKACLSGPLVRSSYQAKEIYDELICA
ncbi:MAG: lipoyl synthase [Candidatus Omnitrophica bacterium]|nr:lipoyl synthase [Candidatus Omnitrophota bacterium]